MDILKKNFYTTTMNLLFFIASFSLLFVVSRLLSRQLGYVLMRFTRNTTLSIYLIAILFFPGVLIHELGHFLMASLLFVPTGEIEFFPKIQEDELKLGSVAIARTDPFRRFLIGVAPVLSGIGILFLAGYYLSPFFPLSWKTLLFSYLLFEVGNTMFSSKKDLEGALGFILFILFMGVSLYILGARLPDAVTLWLHAFSQWTFLGEISLWLLAGSVINVLLWLLCKAIQKR